MNTRHRFHVCHQPSGFTLLEVLVVIIVLGILAAIVGPRIIGRVGEAQTTAAKTQIEMFAVALDNYRLDNGYYPTTEQGLAALRAEPTTGQTPRNWRGPYLRREVPLDPWDRAYIYISPGDHNPGSFDLMSLGRDGRPGGEGEDADINSWQ